jgi:hypothetical protein
MLHKIIVNSRTSGKFTREIIEGDSHIVTTMMPIRGDIAMNKRLYSNAEVDSSYMQLNMLPAPHGHPTVNGIKVPAFHPIANNKHNIGGFLRNPRKKGKRVFVDFLLNETVANNSEEGRAVIKRIEENKKVGVSTGLTAESVVTNSGTDDFGAPYDAVLGGLHFDHVAILLNEVAAGEHAGTELILNENNEDISVSSIPDNILVNELSSSEIRDSLSNLIRPAPHNLGNYGWINDIYPESKTFIYQLENEATRTSLIYKQAYAINLEGEVVLVGDKIAGKLETVFTPAIMANNNEVDDMDKNAIVLAIIANSANAFTINDNTRLQAMTDDELNSIIATGVDAAGAKTILANAGFKFEDYDKFIANEAEFNAYMTSEETRLNTIRESIVANSKYTTEMLTNKSEEELNLLSTLIKPEGEHKQRANEQEAGKMHNNSADSDEPAVDYT